MFGYSYGPEEWHWNWRMYGPYYPFSGVVLGFSIVVLAIAVFYILTLRRALLRCAPHNRAAVPNTAWLLIVPFFNLFWPFFLYPRISESLEREFRERALPIEPFPARTLGLTLAILNLSCVIPLLNLLTGIATLVCFILYWNKISGYSRQLASGSGADSQASTAPPSMGAPASGPSAPQGQAAGRYCTTCGNPIRNGERFCSNCGSPVS
jgi:hypothetical protein